MASKNFHYTILAIQMLEKILGSRFKVTGLENLPKHPVLFVANHFTRFETFIIPYLIYKNTGRKVRCLASNNLFGGSLGKFLESVGTISTKDKKRDKIILKDLIEGEYDWMIYPEGSMVKSKKIIKGRSFSSQVPGAGGRTKTGSAVLGLKSEIYRDDLISAYKKKNDKILNELKKDLDISYSKKLEEINTHIVPVNISYYPLRPGKNKIQTIIGKFFKKIPKRIGEELEIEGNLLLGSDITINFSPGIDLKKYVNNTKKVIYNIPIIKRDTKANFILKYHKYRLTYDFMEKVYSNIEINFDHLFAGALYHCSREEIRVGYLKRIIYLSGSMIENLQKYRIHDSALEENLYKVFLNEKHTAFDSVFKLAKEQKLIKEIGDGKIVINKKRLQEEHDFHEIRRENSLQVILNEFLLLDVANDAIRKNIKIPTKHLRKKVFDRIYKKDLEIYDRDYKTFFDQSFSKDKSIGSPFFLNNEVKSSKKISKTGVILIHGYKSAPEEVRPLAKFLNGFGYTIYAPRLKGHGTAPANLQYTRWVDWYDSAGRAYAALYNMCDKIIIVGFSTGGLISLYSSVRKTVGYDKLQGIVSINSALKLRDIKTIMVPGINLWNEMLSKLNIKKGKLEYIDDIPENPHINYSRNYLTGVAELSDLMEVCEDNLAKVTKPTLIIQGSQDKVVSPKSGKIIYKNISSKKKTLHTPNFSNHVIINCARQEEIFALIKEFFDQL